MSFRDAMKKLGATKNDLWNFLVNLTLSAATNLEKFNYITETYEDRKYETKPAFGNILLQLSKSQIWETPITYRTIGGFKVQFPTLNIIGGENPGNLISRYIPEYSVIVDYLTETITVKNLSKYQMKIAKTKDPTIVSRPYAFLKKLISM